MCGTICMKSENTQKYSIFSGCGKSVKKNRWVLKPASSYTGIGVCTGGSIGGQGSSISDSSFLKLGCASNTGHCIIFYAFCYFSKIHNK